MSRRISIVITHLELHALPPSRKFETAAEAEARRAKLKPKVLAALAGLSPSYFYPVFKSETGMTITQRVRQIRTDRGSDLLVNTFLQVTEIAYQCDYADVYHFSRDFKLDRKLCPREYRRKHDKNNSS